MPDSLTKLVGSWRGNNTLHVPWLDPPQSKSDAAATITPVVNGKFVTIAHTWADHGDDAFEVVMTNIAPNGEETVAVETRYDRHAGA